MMGGFAFDTVEEVDAFHAKALELGAGRRPAGRAHAQGLFRISATSMATSCAATSSDKFLGV
jgi:hypothetical protein